MAANIGSVVAAVAFIGATIFFYRAGVAQHRPAGFCLFVFRVICVAMLSAFTAVLVLCLTADPGIQETCTRIGFFSALCGFCFALAGNVGKCGSKHS